MVMLYKYQCRFLMIGCVQKLKPPSEEFSYQLQQYSDMQSFFFQIQDLTRSYLFMLPIWTVWLRFRIPPRVGRSSYSQSFQMWDFPSQKTYQINCIDLQGLGEASKSSSSSTMLCLTGLPNFSSISNFTSLRYSFSKSLSSAVLKLTDPFKCLIEASSLKSPEIFLVQLLLLLLSLLSEAFEEFSSFLLWKLQLTAMFLSLFSQGFELPMPQQELWLLRNLQPRSFILRDMYLSSLVFLCSPESFTYFVEGLLQLGLSNFWSSSEEFLTSPILVLLVLMTLTATLVSGSIVQMFEPANFLAVKAYKDFTLTICSEYFLAGFLGFFSQTIATSGDLDFLGLTSAFNSCLLLLLLMKDVVWRLMLGGGDRGLTSGKGNLRCAMPQRVTDWLILTSMFFPSLDLKDLSSFAFPILMEVKKGLVLNVLF